LSINLTKGGNVNLTKDAPNPLTTVKVGLGWNVRTTSGSAFDLDGSAFILNSSGKVNSSDDFIYFNNLRSSNDSIIHSSDNLTGVGDGDDEVITINLTKLSADVDKVVIAVNIYDASNRNQNFGQVSKAYIRIVNADTDEEMARYDLSEDSSTETSMVFGELYRNDADWKFRAVGQGFQNGLSELTTNFGL